MSAGEDMNKKRTCGLWKVKNFEVWRRKPEGRALSEAVGGEAGTQTLDQAAAA
jgi:hypothetical protein